MSDAETDFTTIERTIVDFLEASGLNLMHDDGEWIVAGPKWPFVKQEMSVTVLACAIHHALEAKGAPK